MRLDMLEKRPQLVALFAGKSGCGKTGAAASFAKGGPVKVLDADHRLGGIQGCSFITPEMKANIDVEPISVREGFKTVDTVLEMEVIKTQQRKNELFCVWLDSAASLSKMFLLESMKLRNAAHGNKLTGKVRGVLQFATPDDYNYASTAWNQLIFEGLIPLKCHVIVTGWTVNVWGPNPKLDEDARAYAPHVVVGEKLLLTEKLSEEVPGYFDDVFLFKKEKQGDDKIKYLIETDGTFAKTKYPELRTGKPLDITGKSVYDILMEKKVLCALTK